MKKSLILVLFALVSVVSYSQVSWNVKAGLNLSNLTEVEDIDLKPGFNVGVGMEYQFSKTWSIQPSLMFSTKGATGKKKLKSRDYTSETEITFNPMYLELPIMAAARFAISDNTNIVLSAGPYLAYGIGGKRTVKETINGESKETEVDLFGDKDGALDGKRFDFGLGVGVTFEFSKFFVGLNGQLGLAKVSDYKKDNSIKDVKNMNFSIGVGYKF